VFIGASAIFIFQACALNVFIAVLGDCYDQEQERMVSSFMKERAKICSDLFMRPQIYVPSPFKRARDARPRCTLFVFVGSTMSLCGFLIWMCWKVEVSAWIPTAVLDLCILLGKGMLRRDITTNWTEGFLWLCCDARIDEELFLAPDDASPVQTYGRICKIKKYILEQTRVIASQYETTTRQSKRIADQARECSMSSDQSKVAELKMVKEGLVKMEKRLEEMHEEQLAQRKWLEQQQEAQMQLVGTCEDIRAALMQLMSDQGQRTERKAKVVPLPAQLSPRQKTVRYSRSRSAAVGEESGEAASSRRELAQ
jgi:hypothetical protein